MIVKIGKVFKIFFSGGRVVFLHLPYVNYHHINMKHHNYNHHFASDVIKSHVTVAVACT